MSIGIQLDTLLRNATDAADQVWPVQNDTQPAAVPYIVYSRISSNSENVLSGRSGLVNSRVQIDVYASTYKQAQTIAAQVDALMTGWAVQNVSNPAQDVYEQDTKLHRVILDYSIWHA